MDKTNYYFCNYYKEVEAGEQALVDAKAKLAELESSTSLEDKQKMKKGIIENVIDNAKLSIERVANSNQAKLINEAVSAMQHAIGVDNYSLTIDCIKDILDCDDRFVADYILEHVDYINAPKYASYYFNSNMTYTCVDQVKLGWKKVFISRSSFAHYLLNNATIKYVYGFGDEKGKLTLHSCENATGLLLDLDFVEFLIDTRKLFRRRCNIGDLIIADKFDKFVGRIVSNYNRKFARAEGISEERRNQELELIKALTPEDLHLQIRTKEITDFIKKNPHLELRINCPGTMDRTAKRTDIADQEKLKKADTATVLYCFNGILGSSIEEKLNALDNNLNQSYTDAEVDLAKKDFAVIRDFIAEGRTDGEFFGSGNARAVECLNELLEPFGYNAYIPSYMDYNGEVRYSKIKGISGKNN